MEKEKQLNDEAKTSLAGLYGMDIEQNAAQYRRILDPANQGIVVEHHSAVTVAEDVNESRPRAPFEKHPTEYAAENWDAPIIVTTSVQFISMPLVNVIC